MARGRASGGAAPGLASPPWLTAALAAAVAAAAFCYPSWPGYMSYDSVMAYDQALYGVHTAAWPPLHTYLFVLSRWLGAGAWGLFLAQTFTLLFGAALALHVLVPRRPLAWTLWLLFVGGLVFFPTLLGSMLAHWRDVPTGGLALLGLGLWLAGAQRRSLPLVLLAVVATALSASLRFNAVVLSGPMFALMIWRPYLDRAPPAWLRAAVAGAVVLALGLAWASMQWRLPDLQRLPAPDGFGATQNFDVVGVSACSGRNYLPATSAANRRFTAADLRRRYDPRSYQATIASHPGVPPISAGHVSETWRRLLVSETGCYLAHRNAVFVEQMGMAKAGVHYPVHPAIERGARGLELAHPAASRAVAAYVQGRAVDPWRRAYLLYPAAAVLALLAGLRNRRLGILLLALVTGALAYPALLFVAAPAADARYIFPSNVLCLLVALASLGILAGAPRRAA